VQFSTFIYLHVHAPAVTLPGILIKLYTILHLQFFLNTVAVQS